MKKIIVPSVEQVSPESREILEQVQKKMGMIPNLYAVIANSAASLKSMMDTEANLSHNSAFTAKEKEAVNLVVSQVNNCDYCLAAHSALAKMRGYSQQDTLDIRKGEYSDVKTNTIIELAKSIALNKGKAEGKFLEAFFDAGYTDGALIELISLIALRTFTNYVFTNTEIPIDFPEALPLD